MGRKCMVLLCCLLGMRPAWQATRACTVGCAVGHGSADGRPITWKNRDADEGNYGVWYRRGREGYGYLAMGPDRQLKMGVNEVGLSLQNSLMTDLNSQGYRYENNTALKEWILTHCAGVAEVRRAIQEDTGGVVDHWPPPSICLMIGDAHGRACSWELAGRTYYEYDPSNAERLAQVPEEFVCRTNTSHRHGDQTDDLRCRCKRYQAVLGNMRSTARSGGISIQEMFGLSRYGEPGVHGSTSNETTRAAMIVHGVNEGEDPRIVTAWVACGRPDYTCYVPVWAAQGDDLSPRVSADREAGLCRRAETLYDKGDRSRYDDYINALLAPMETNFIDAVAAARARWLQSGFRLDEARRIHQEAAETAWQTMSSLCRGSGRSLNRTPILTAVETKADGLSVSLRCVADDPDGRIAAYDWDFGDGGGVSSASCAHTYRAAGTYLVRCRVTDDQGARNSRWAYVSVR